MTTSTSTAAPPDGLHPDDKADVDRIAGMDPPQARLALLGEYVTARNDAWKAEHARTIHVAWTLLQAGHTPASIYKRVGVTRSLFNTWTRQVPAGTVPYPGNPDIALGVHAAARRRHLAARDYAKNLRDEAILEVLDGPEALSNAEIGRLAGVTGQRITQMRTGVS